MEEQILRVKNLYDNGIDKSLFFRVNLNVINAYDGYREPMRAYANYLKIANWQELLSKPNLGIAITNDQLAAFFEYMVKYHYRYFGKDQGHYFVHREFMDNDLRKEENFKFETILLTAFEII